MPHRLIRESSVRLYLACVVYALLHTKCSCFALLHSQKCGSISRTLKNHHCNIISSRSATEIGTARYPCLFLSANSNKLSDQDSKTSESSSLGKRVVDLYVGYCKRLWRETSPVARKKSAKDKAILAVERVQNLVKGSDGDLRNEYWNLDAEEDPDWIKAKKTMLDACDTMLQVMKKEHPEQRQLPVEHYNLKADEHSVDSVGLRVQNEPSHASKRQIDAGKHVPTISISNLYSNSVPSEQQHILVGKPTEVATTEPSSSITPKRKKPRRSILFGAAMGSVVACWVFSGNFIFTALFTLMTILGQLEFYRMAMNAGIYPARRISVCGACAMFITALFFPNAHQVCLPLFATWAMIWFLTMRRTVSTLSEIAATFTGMFLFGYMPSFWIQIRLIGSEREPTKIAPLVTPMLSLLGKTASSLPAWIPKAIHLPITTGAVYIFWTWLSIAFSDVGAYFTGRYFGRTKLKSISPAAGATSPNKTVEGVIGGTLTSVLFSLCGAWVQKWPYWRLTGVVHGIFLALLGLIGDLTASMLKRDAGLKDFGDLIPEHGGILDRVDSFIFTAPYSWIVLTYIIPALKTLSCR
mmetsp:Transcript_2203/g.3381  ORF Transcript_2203/g.3381 Transcript_2203/m.3381 type:complete len:582 (+) Transcript_2203:111-1856(+)